MADPNDQFPMREPLPPELEPLYQRLLDDGAAWRARLPSTERLEQRLNTLAHQEQHARPTAEADEQSGRRSGPRLIHQMKGRDTMFQGRLKTALAVVTIAAVVALFAVLFYGFAGHSTKTAIPKNTATNPPSHQKYSADVPIVAPSDPNVIYKLVPADGSPGHMLLARSTDGGASWRTFSLPTVTGGDAAPLVAFVSSLNPQDVFLTVSVKLSTGTSQFQPCPKSVTSSGLSSDAALSGGSPYCDVEFLSTDGGANWSRVHLPADAAPAALGDPSGYIFGSPLFSNGATVFHVQGNRLYSTTNVEPGDPPSSPEAQSTLTIRIVVSTDGGLNWAYVDEAVASSGQNICDYAATPSGSTLFAVTSTGCNNESAPPAFLWRSDDTGAHWTKVGQLPGNAELGMLALSRDNGQPPLLYINMATETCTSSPYIYRPDSGSCGIDTSPANLQVSADGGKTWQSAPTKGFPTTQPGNKLQNPGAPLGALSDGSLLFLAFSGQGSSSFYTWKLGDTSWHQVGPNFNSVDSVFVVPGANNTVCLVTGYPDFEVHTFSA